MNRRLRRTAIISSLLCYYNIEAWVFHPCLWIHRYSGSWHGHYGGAAAVQWCLIPTFHDHGLLLLCFMAAMSTECLDLLARKFVYLREINVMPVCAVRLLKTDTHLFRPEAIFGELSIFWRKNPNACWHKRKINHPQTSDKPLTCGDRVNLVWLGQYHGCWCPGFLRRQDINSHDIDYVE